VAARVASGHGARATAHLVSSSQAESIVHAVSVARAKAPPSARRGCRPNSPLVFFAVRLERGGPWDWSRDLREQDDCDEHAQSMDCLVDDGFIVLGGPLKNGPGVLHAISAPSEEAVCERLAEDSWARNGMLKVKSIEAWTILLDGRST